MLGVAAVAAVVSYEHASSLVRVHGEPGWTGRLIPVTVDGLMAVDRVRGDLSAAVARLEAFPSVVIGAVAREARQRRSWSRRSTLWR